MSQTINVLKWCDNALVHGADTEPATVARTVLNEQGKPVVLDLCAVDDLKVQAVFELAKYGSQITGANIKPKPRTQGQRVAADAERKFPCPRCDYKAINKDGLGKHTRRQHGLTTQQALAEAGMVDSLVKSSYSFVDDVSQRPTTSAVVEGPLPRRTSKGSGRPPAGTPTPWKCKVPKCWHPGSVSLNGLWQHTMKHHNLTREEYRQRYGAPTEETS